MRGSIRGSALTDTQAVDQEQLVAEGLRPQADTTSTAALGLASKPLSPRRLAWRRFRRHKLAVASTILLIVIVFMCVFANMFTHYSIHSQIRIDGPNSPLASFLSPRHGHLFGTDDAGYDEWTAVLYGGRISLAVGAAVAVIATIIGAAFGVVSGYYGGKLGEGMMRLTDLFLAFPLIVILIIFMNLPANQPWAATLMGQAHSMRAVITIMALFFWMGIARVIRALTLQLKEKEFVEAARAAGASDTRIMVRHILPNCAGQIIINTTLNVAAAILIESVLSFLGYGLDPVKATSWGILIAHGQGQTDVAPYLVWIPGIAILLVVLCVNFMGDGLRDALDPKQLSV
jgi:peptide/nickel transport system permease protein